MIERFQPSAAQLQSLSDEEYSAFLAITIAMLQGTEQRYDIPNLEEMSEAEVANWLETQQLQIEREYEAATDDLLNGGTVESWERDLVELVIAGALLALLFGFGGIGGLRSQSSAVTLVRQSREVMRGQLAAIRTTAKRIQQGQLTPAQIKAGKYRRASAFKESYERGRIVDAITNQGHNEGIRRLGNPHPCPDCPRHERREWVPIEEIVPIATLCVCQQRCKCFIVTRFNRERFIAGVQNGDARNILRRYEDNLNQGRVAFLSRYGWLNQPELDSLQSLRLSRN